MCKAKVVKPAPKPKPKPKFVPKPKVKVARSPRATTPKTIGGGSSKVAPGAPAVERPGRGGPKSLGKRVALQTDLYATVHTGLAACDPAEYVAQLMVLARTQARLIRARREVRAQIH